MNNRLTLCLVLLSILQIPKAAAETTAQCPGFLNHEFKKLHSSKTINLCELYKNKPLVIINTASHCGYTHQFKGLEALYQKYKKEGVELIGFASNDFKQAAKSEEEAATICYKNYGVSFTMLAPTHVRGKEANPVFTHLNEQTRKPGWNFNKYFISADGKHIKHFGSNTKPLSSKLETAVKQAL
ncbi:glutathione peroxidase [Teredinibacter haidensis]|uniref:glutathione peroxidase n=1 Tax=Teredinibacter haidensis TaxID=2731755 RepID=UPI000948F283|nr:redoxin domain-containing protein [Teredinibacter haidensis]